MILFDLLLCLLVLYMYLFIRESNTVTMGTLAGGGGVLCMKPWHYLGGGVRIGYITRWRSLCDLHTEGRRPEAV